MKRGRQTNPREYIEIRIEQLLEDRKKEKEALTVNGFGVSSAS